MLQNSPKEGSVCLEAGGLHVYFLTVVLLSLKSR